MHDATHAAAHVDVVPWLHHMVTVYRDTAKGRKVGLISNMELYMWFNEHCTSAYVVHLAFWGQLYGLLLQGHVQMEHFQTDS